MGRKQLSFGERMRLVDLALQQGPEAVTRLMGVNPSTAYTG
jgi:hypothetical protein